MSLKLYKNKAQAHASRRIPLAILVTLGLGMAACQPPPPPPPPPTTVPPVQPTSVPNAPASISATSSNAQASIAWTPPSSNGGASITGYYVKSSPIVSPPASCTNTLNLNCVFTGLTNGTSYTFSVVARNKNGDSNVAVSSPVTPAAIRPGTPTNVDAFGANTAIDVTWGNPSSNGGTSVTAFTATATSGGSNFTCTTASNGCTITGLSNNTPYQVQVIATNRIGDSPPSAALSSTPNTTMDCTRLVPYANLQNCFLFNLGFDGADLTGATLTGVSSQGLYGTPKVLPDKFRLVSGFLLGPNVNVNVQMSLNGSDLSNIDLSGATISGNLSSTNLTGAILDHTNLTGDRLGTLTNANLSGANISNTWIIGDLNGVQSGGITGTPNELTYPWALVGGYLIGPGANLNGANLNALDLTNTQLSNTSGIGVASGGITGTPAALPLYWKLIGGYLIGPGANLNGANLNGLNLATASLSTPTTYIGVKSGGITGTPISLPSDWQLIGGFLIGPSANLANANLGGQNLSGVNLSNYAILSGANLSNTNLVSANLTNVMSGGIIGTPLGLPTSWIIRNGYLVGPGANLVNALLSGADLVGANLAGTNLEGADLSGSDLTGIDLSNTKLAGSNLSGAKLISVNLSGRNLNGSNLTYSTINNANLSGTILSGAQLTGVHSTGLTGTPASLPTAWSIVGGSLVYTAPPEYRQGCWYSVNGQSRYVNETTGHNGVWCSNGTVYAWWFGYPGNSTNVITHPSPF